MKDVIICQQLTTALRSFCWSKSLCQHGRFTGQTKISLKAFTEVNVCIVNVPINTPKYCQPLCLTVNFYVKCFFIKKLTTGALKRWNPSLITTWVCRISKLVKGLPFWNFTQHRSSSSLTTLKGQELIGSGWRTSRFLVH